MRSELLAPAGSFESMISAVMAGADAVYMGGNRFGARAYADNPKEDQLKEAIDFCHLHDVRLYLTVNTLVKEGEMNQLYEFLAPYYETGLDGVIVQDLGVLSYLKRQFPGMELHASTQMNVHNADSARLLKNYGVDRVVLARELSLEEIREIAKTGAELEVFVHGALCYCYSGQCLLSSMIGGRSGNRGRCAQPCRLPYQAEADGRRAEGHLLSPKDICTLELLPEILSAGVYSLKIEGRMKRPEYVAGVVRIYRKYLDLYRDCGREGYRVRKEDIRQLMDLYNRGGFCEGYFRTSNGPKMMSISRQNHYGTVAAKVLESGRGLLKLKALEPLSKGDVLEDATLPNPVAENEVFTIKKTRAASFRAGDLIHRTTNAALLSELQKYQDLTYRKEKINGKLILSPSKPVILDLECRAANLSVQGQMAEPSRNQALSSEVLLRQMKKTGGTSFEFEHLEVELHGDCFLPMKAVNDLRRRGLERIREELLKPYRRNKVGKLAAYEDPVKGAEPSEYQGERPETEILVNTREQLFALRSEDMDRLYVEAVLLLKEDRENVLDFLSALRREGVEVYLAMPHLLRGARKDVVRQEVLLPFQSAFDGVLVRNLEGLSLAEERKAGWCIHGDDGLYSWNKEARRVLKSLGVSMDTAPAEENQKELAARGMQGSSLLVYGRNLLMISAQCIKKTLKHCDRKSSLLFLKDRKGIRFPVVSQCEFCYNKIYNSTPLVLYDLKDEIRKLSARAVRLAFTLEGAEEVRSVLQSFRETFLEDGEGTIPSSYTRGHFKRGVE